jgi:hypothetical protein
MDLSVAEIAAWSECRPLLLHHPLPKFSGYRPENRREMNGGTAPPKKLQSG